MGWRGKSKYSLPGSAVRKRGHPGTWPSEARAASPPAGFRRPRPGPLRSALQALHALELVQGTFIPEVAGVEGGGRLEQQDPGFFIGHGAVLDAARDYKEFSLFQPDVAVAKFHAEAAFDHEKKFIFVCMVVPDELTFQFVELDHLAVEFASDVGLPVLGGLGKLVGEIDLIHGASRAARCLRGYRMLVSPTLTTERVFCRFSAVFYA